LISRLTVGGARPSDAATERIDFPSPPVPDISRISDGYTEGTFPVSPRRPAEEASRMNQVRSKPAPPDYRKISHIR
jgi:hypothetical protein